MLFICELVVTVGVVTVFFFFQAEDGIRDLVRSRGLGDVYKRQPHICAAGLIMLSKCMRLMRDSMKR